MTADLLFPFVRENGVVILDGAMATELERRGADLNDPLWSARVLLEAPELIRQVHLDYFLAGADVATTASYQATFEGFSRRGLSEEEAIRLMQLSVQLACDARDQYWAEAGGHGRRVRPLVAASMGSFGAYLADGSEYRGDYDMSLENLMDFHRRRVEVLLRTKADLLACETVPCLVEGQALIKLLAEFPDAQAWLSFSCCDERHVCHGEKFADCTALANESKQIVAVGLNCTAPRFVEPLLQSVSGSTDRYLLAYPNSGEDWDARRRSWLAGERISDFGGMALRWHEAGASLLGGCCRTTPEDIRAIAAVFRKDRPEHGTN